jgi:hypothetical protein
MNDLVASTTSGPNQGLLYRWTETQLIFFEKMSTGGGK